LWIKIKIVILLGETNKPVTGAEILWKNWHPAIWNVWNVVQK